MDDRAEKRRIKAEIREAELKREQERLEKCRGAIKAAPPPSDADEKPFSISGWLEH